MLRTLILFVAGGLSLIPGPLSAQPGTPPVSLSDDSIFVADPFVLWYDQTYYLYGTSADDGFRAWKSSNLMDWDTVGYVYRRSEASWAQDSFWAPEVVYYRGKFYLIFSAKGTAPDGLRICLAVSDSPKGPFRDLHVPLFDHGFSCIDGHLFVDQDQTPYLYYEMVGAVGKPHEEAGYFWGMIFGVQLSQDLSGLVRDEPQLCVYPTQDWENPTGTLARSTEGMTVFQHDSTYYMTYSANHYTDPQYGVGYATAPHPLGPWTKSMVNPILSQRPELGLSGPGHNGVVCSPDTQELFIVYHSHADPGAPSVRRMLNVDRLVIDPDGTLRVVGPRRRLYSPPSGARLPK